MITEDHYKELEKVMSLAVENDHLFSEWEQAFISDWADKLNQYKEKIKISDKQQGVLDRIEEKLRRDCLL